MKSDGPPLTVAIPVYKRAHAVGPLLRSLAAQAGPEDDLVVIDDASGDGIEQTVAGVGRFRLIENESNLGMVGNWNACLRTATRDWVCIIHHDDEVAPDALQTLRRVCARAAAPALVMHWRTDPEQGRELRCRWCEPGPWPVLNVPTIPSGVVVHHRIVEEVGGFNARWKYSADLEYFPRICTRFPLVIIESPDVVRYRLHGANYQYETWCKPDFEPQLEDIQRLILQYAGLSAENAAGPLEDRMQALHRYMLASACAMGDRRLLRCLGPRIVARRSNGRKLRWQAALAAHLGWYAKPRRPRFVEGGINLAGS